MEKRWSASDGSAQTAEGSFLKLCSCHALRSLTGTFAARNETARHLLTETVVRIVVFLGSTDGICERHSLACMICAISRPPPSRGLLPSPYPSQPFLPKVMNFSYHQALFSCAPKCRRRLADRRHACFGLWHCEEAHQIDS